MAAPAPVAGFRGRVPYVDLRFFSTVLAWIAAKMARPRRSRYERRRGTARRERVREGDFAALDEQRFAAFHWRATLVTGLGVFCDGYDLSSVGIVLPLILKS